MTVPTHLERPWDYSPAPRKVAGASRTHRFPAATYLDRAVAREERALAQQLLAASSRSASRATGALATLVLLALATMVAVVATGRAETALGLQVLWGAGAVAALGSLGVLTRLRRHDRLAHRLGDQVRAYETRLLELRAQRRRVA